MKIAIGNDHAGVEIKEKIKIISQKKDTRLSTRGMMEKRA